MSEKKRITAEFIGYKSVISSLIRRLTFVSGPEIEDILQETYIRTYQSALKREIKFPKAFMVKTALRLAKQQQAKAETVASEVDIEALSPADHTVMEESHTHSPETDTIKMEEFKLLSHVINELPPKCRKVFIMKKIYGLSQKEIATSLDLSESTVEKHIAKGMLYCVRGIDKTYNNTANEAPETQAWLGFKRRD